jgi:hypothetical protein
MAHPFETMTDDAVGILEKIAKAKDTKAKSDLHKKANAKLKELQKHVADAVADFTERLNTSTQTLEEAFGIASSEAGLRDHEIVRHLKQAIKLSQGIDRPKGWTDDYDKAGKTVSSWDPKAGGNDELDKGIKQLEAAKKHLLANLAANYKQENECNVFVDKAIADTDSLKNDELKKHIMPYLNKYAAFFSGKP